MDLIIEQVSVWLSFFPSFFCLIQMKTYDAGIGGQTALKLIRQHGSIENILENINKERYLFAFCCCYVKWFFNLSGEGGLGFDTY